MFILVMLTQHLYLWHLVGFFISYNNDARSHEPKINNNLLFAEIREYSHWSWNVYSKILAIKYVYCLYKRCATSRTVPGSIPGGVTWEFFRGSFRQNHVPLGRFSLWKWVPGISLGVRAAGAFGWRPTTLVVPKVEKIRGRNLPGTPRATSACRGIPLLTYCLYKQL